MAKDIYILHVYRSRQYMSCKDAAEYYGYSSDRIRELAHEMEELPRYKNTWIIINDDGLMLINTLALEDFFKYRSAIRNGMSKHLPPYDPTEIRRQRGEVIDFATG